MQFLPGQDGGISQGGARRLRGQRRVLLVDLRVAHPGGEAVEDDAHGDPRAAEGRLSVHDRWVGVDQREEIPVH